jgi:hypothetical protein
MTLPQLRTAFDGQQLITLDVGGRPGWVAQHIGALLGYAGRGRRLVKKIRGEWMSEFLHGHDYVKVDSDLVLLKPGLDLVLSRTCKTIGKRLRRHVIDEVLPLFQGVETPPTMAIESTCTFVERERRLRAKLELEDRRFRSTSLQRTARVLRDLGRIDDDGYALCEVASVEIALGTPLPSNMGGAA